LFSYLLCPKIGFIFWFEKAKLRSPQAPLIKGGIKGGIEKWGLGGK